MPDTVTNLDEEALALAEGALSDAAADDDDDALDWGAAMAEQEAADQAAQQEADMAQASFSAPAMADSTDWGRKDRVHDVDFILDIPVVLTVELGRTKLPIKNLLQLAQGSVVELDGLAGEPMDVLINGCLIAQGEVVVVNDKFGIRLTDVITPAERIRKLNR